MRLRRWGAVVAAVVAVAGAAVVATSSAAGASGGHRGGGTPPGAWTPFRSEPFTDKAGDVCSFELKGDIVKDRERVRTLLSYPDGTPLEQEFTGPLFIRFTNTSNGKSVVRDLSGTGWWFFGKDGTIEGRGDGHMGLGIHAVNTSPAPGEYYLSGLFDFVIHPDNTRDFTFERGSAENLCETLS